jgi:16S rRNA (guanine527-N7)-methyltransferase
MRHLTGAARNASADMEIGSLEWNRLIVDGAGQLNIPLHLEHAERMALHASELIRWNRKMNLTTIREPMDVAVKHYLDSIIPAAFIKTGSSLLDIGSGGGFPGIPLKIFMPSLSVTMIDATRKKVSFMNHAIRLLDLKDIRAMHIRLENLIKDLSLHHSFDVITCRAFASLKHFAMNAMPLLKPDGVLIALKGREAEKELKQMTPVDDRLFKLGLAKKKDIRISLTVEVSRWKLPYLDEERLLIMLRH